MANNLKLLTGICVIFLLLIAVAAYMVFKGDIEEKDTSESTDMTGVFTFFDVGPKTRLTQKLKEELEEKLGSDSLETWSTIDLEFLFSGFLKEHFPKLHQLNRKLNDERGQRVEHNTVKLTYRYIPKDITPFDYAELMFSRPSGLPLYCYVKAKKDGQEILSLLESKYKDSKKIDWGGPEDYSFFWEKSGNLLLFSNTPDLLGNPEYQIVIYFTNNLEKLIENEIQKNSSAEDKKNNVLKKAF